MVRYLVFLALLVAGFAQAADTTGIVPGQEFRIPFQVDGQPLAKGGKAAASIGSDGVGTIRVMFARDGDAEELFYTITRSDSPTPTPTPGPSPTPVPVPKPDPRPVEPAKYQILFFHESGDLDNLTSAQQDMLAGLAFRSGLTAKGHVFLGSLDKNSITAAGGQWAEWVKGQATPGVCLAPVAGGDVIRIPLPADEAEFWKKLESGGK